jgi:hypothetical protein
MRRSSEPLHKGLDGCNDYIAPTRPQDTTAGGFSLRTGRCCFYSVVALFKCSVNPFKVVKSLLAVKAIEEVLFEVVRLGLRKSSIEVVVQLLACPRLNADKLCL